MVLKLNYRTKGRVENKRLIRLDLEGPLIYIKNNFYLNSNIYIDQQSSFFSRYENLCSNTYARKIVFRVMHLTVLKTGLSLY